MNHYVKDFSAKIKNLFLLAVKYKAQSVFVGITFVTAFTLALIFSWQIILFLEGRVPFPVKFVQNAPDEMIVNTFKVSFFTAVFLILPVLFYQIAKIKLDMSKDNCKMNVIKLIAISFASGLFGVLLSCFVLIPFQLYFLLGFNMGLAYIELDISKHISFCLGTALISFMVFQIPMAVYLSKKNAFFSFSQIASVREYAIIASLVLAFLVTSPPEFLSFAFLSFWFYLIYIFVLFLVKK